MPTIVPVTLLVLLGIWLVAAAIHLAIRAYRAPRYRRRALHAPLAPQYRRTVRS